MAMEQGKSVGEWGLRDWSKKEVQVEDKDDKGKGEWKWMGKKVKEGEGEEKVKKKEIKDVEKMEKGDLAPAPFSP